MLLLVPSATYRVRDFLEAGRRMGVEVVVASDRRQAMAAALGERALTIPLARPEAAAERIVALAERSPLDAVVAVDDAGVVAAALAAERLGLVHNPPAAVLAARDKQRDEGYLFWLAWTAQNGNSVFSTADGSGPFRRLFLNFSCATFRDLAAENPAALTILGVTELLQDTRLCPIGEGGVDLPELPELPFPKEGGPQVSSEDPQAAPEDHAGRGGSGGLGLPLDLDGLLHETPPVIPSLPSPPAGDSSEHPLAVPGVVK